MDSSKRRKLAGLVAEMCEGELRRQGLWKVEDGDFEVEVGVLRAVKAEVRQTLKCISTDDISGVLAEKKTKADAEAKKRADKKAAAASSGRAWAANKRKAEARHDAKARRQAPQGL